MLAISFKTDSAAFGHDSDGDGPVLDTDAKVIEINRILHLITDAITADYVGCEISDTIRDINGNTIGTWVLK